MICGWRFDYGNNLCGLEKEWKSVSTFLRCKMECFLSQISKGCLFLCLCERGNNTKPPLDAEKGFSFSTFNLIETLKHLLLWAHGSNLHF